MAKKKKPKSSSRSRKSKTASRASRSPKGSPKKKSSKKKVPAKKARASKQTTDDSKSAGANEVTIDRRHNSDRLDQEVAAEQPFAEGPAIEKPSAATTAAKAPTLERRKKVNRRRQIDPTTCERDYSDSEVEFMNALDDYKRKNGRMFPTCSEVLEVIRELGYVQLSPVELAAREPNPTVKPETADAPSEDTSSDPIVAGFKSTPDDRFDESKSVLEELTL